MTRVTFRVSASPFAANMAVRQNTMDYVTEFPLATEAVLRSFYVDDGLTGASSISEAVELQNQPQSLFAKGGFLLRKWNSSCPSVIEQIPPELRDIENVLSIKESPG